MIAQYLRTLRNLSVSFLFILLLISPNRQEANAAPISTLNFRWWSTAGESAREGAVQGAIDGIKAAWTIGYYDSRGDVGAVVYREFKLGRIAEKDMWSVTSAMGFENIHYGPRFSKPVSAYVKALSKFYATYKAERDKSIVFPLELCLSDHPTESCEKTSTHHYRL